MSMLRKIKQEWKDIVIRSVGIGVLVPYCLYQFYSLWKYGTIYSGPTRTSHWMSLAEDPFWFLIGLFVYGFFLLLVLFVLALDSMQSVQLRRHQRSKLLRLILKTRRIAKRAALGADYAILSDRRRRKG